MVQGTEETATVSYECGVKGSEQKRVRDRSIVQGTVLAGERRQHRAEVGARRLGRDVDPATAAVVPREWEGAVALDGGVAVRVVVVLQLEPQPGRRASNPREVLPTPFRLARRPEL